MAEGMRNRMMVNGENGENGGIAEWRNGRMAEWWNGGMVEWRNCGMAEWRNGRTAEWRNGGNGGNGAMAGMVEWWEWWNGRMAKKGWKADGMVRWRRVLYKKLIIESQIKKPYLSKVASTDKHIVTRCIPSRFEFLRNSLNKYPVIRDKFIPKNYRYLIRKSQRSLLKLHSGRF